MHRSASLDWRRFLIRAAILGAVFFIVAGTAFRIVDSLQRQGMVYGWGFLFQATGWDVSVAPLGHQTLDPYWWTILTGTVNTLVLAACVIVSTTILGFLIGLGCLSRNPLVAFVTRLYTDIFRNIPSILQIVFWYQVILHLPVERRAIVWPGGGLLSNRGAYFPWPSVDSRPAAIATVIALAMLAGFLVMFRGASRRSRLAATGGAVLLIVLAALVLGTPFAMVYPKLAGFAIQGGLRMPSEFLALFVGLTVLGTAYVAEIVRGGLLSVNRGPLEAGRALGLRDWVVNWTIRIPLGLRAIVPPLGNQYLITVKNTSLGAAIGYADLFAITSNSINMNGHTFEMLGIMVGIYLVVNYSFSLVIERFNSKIALKGFERSRVARAA